MTPDPPNTPAGRLWYGVAVHVPGYALKRYRQRVNGFADAEAVRAAVRLAYPPPGRDRDRADRDGFVALGGQFRVVHPASGATFVVEKTGRAAARLVTVLGAGEPPVRPPDPAVTGRLRELAAAQRADLTLLGWAAAAARPPIEARVVARAAEVNRLVTELLDHLEGPPDARP